LSFGGTLVEGKRCSTPFIKTPKRDSAGVLQQIQSVSLVLQGIAVEGKDSKTSSSKGRVKNSKNSEAVKKSKAPSSKGRGGSSSNSKCINREEVRSLSKSFKDKELRRKMKVLTLDEILDSSLVCSKAFKKKSKKNSVEKQIPDIPETPLTFSEQLQEIDISLDPEYLKMFGGDICNSEDELPIRDDEVEHVYEELYPTKKPVEIVETDSKHFELDAKPSGKFENRSVKDKEGVVKAKKTFRKAKKQQLYKAQVARKKDLQRVRDNGPEFKDPFEITSIDQLSKKKIQRMDKQREASEFRKMATRNKAHKKEKKKERQAIRKQTADNIHVESDVQILEQKEDFIFTDEILTVVSGGVSSEIDFESTRTDYSALLKEAASFSEAMKKRFSPLRDNTFRKVSSAGEFCQKIYDKLEQYGYRISMTTLGVMQKIFAELQEKYKEFKLNFEELLESLLNFVRPIYDILKTVVFESTFDWKTYVFDFVLVLWGSIHISDPLLITTLVYAISSKYLGTAYSLIFSCVTGLIRYVINGSMRAERETIQVEGLSDVGDFLDTMLSSELYGSIKTLFVSLFSFKFFGKAAENISNIVFGGKDTGSVLHLVRNIITAIERLVAISALIYGGMSLREAFFVKNPYEVYKTDIRRLLRTEVYYGLPDDDKIPACDFLRDFKRLKEDRDVYLKTRVCRNSQWEAVENLYYDLAAKARAIKTRLESHRLTPISIINFGNPGVGKSTILEAVTFVMCDVFGWKHDPNIVFSKVLSSEYWEGYDPTCQKIIHLSELGNVAANIVKSQGDPTLNEFCSLVSGEYMSLNMAEASNKGKVAASPYCVFTDTNNESLNAELATSHPAAVRRRSIYVEQIVNIDYRKGGSCELDTDKMTAETDYDEVWTFNVYRYRSQDSRKSVKTDMQSLNWTGLIKFFRGVFIVYAEKLSNALDVSTDIEAKVKKALYGDEEEDLPIDEDFGLNVVESDEKQLMPDGDALSIPISSGNEQLSSDGGASSTYVDSDEGYPFGKKYLCSCNYTKASCVFTNLNQEEWRPMRIQDIVAENNVVPQDGILSKIRQGYDYVKNSVVQKGTRAYNVAKHTGRVINKCSLFGKYTVLSLRARTKYWLIEEYVKETSDISLDYFLFLLVCVLSMCLVNPLIGCIMGLIVFAYTAKDWKKFTPNSFAKHALISHIKKRQVNAEFQAQNAWDDLVDYVSDDIFVSDNLHFVKKDLTVLMGTITFFVSGYLLQKQMRKFLSGGQSNSSKIIPDKMVENTEANRLGIEDMFLASNSYRRVGNSQIENWTNMRRNVTSPPYTGSADKFLNLVGGNVRPALVTRTEKGSMYANSTFVFMLKGRLGLIHKHNFPAEGVVTISVSNTAVMRESAYTSETVINVKSLQTVHEDLYLVRLENVGEFKDLTKHLYKEEIEVGQGFIYNTATTFTLVQKDINVRLNGDNGYISYSPSYEYSWTDHKRGSCGLPLIAQVKNNGFCIIGLHSAGSDSTDMAYAIPFSGINLDGMHDEKHIQGVEFRLDALNLVDPTPKSIVKFMPITTMEYYGKINDITVLPNQKSRLKRTFFNTKSSLRNFLYENGIYDLQEFDKPVMRHFTKNGFYLCPYQQNLQQFCGVRKCPDSAILDLSVDLFFQRIDDGLGELKLSPWDTNTAINGSELDMYCRNLNMSTGTGFGLKGKKYEHFDKVSIDGYDKYIMKPSLKELVTKRILEIIEGTTLPFIYEGCLKDEPVSLAKRDIAKTRLFCSGNLVDLIVMRQFLGPLLTLLVEQGDLFFTSVGIDAHRDGSKFMQFFEFDEDSWPYKFGEGDYKYYDKKQSTSLARAMNKLLYMIASKCGYNEASLLVMTRILEMNTVPFFIVLGDLYSVPGAQPSGMYGTAETNSLKGAIMVIYAYLKLVQNKEDIWKKIRFKTYGDDVLMAIHDSVQELFDMVKFSVVVKEDFGLDFTSSDKETELKPFTPFEEISFLKRRIIFDQELERYIMPLDISSIVRSLEWTNPSESITQEIQMISCCQSALREIYFHRNIDYDQFRAFIIEELNVAYNFGDNFLNSKMPTREALKISLQPQQQDVSGGSTSLKMNYGEDLSDSISKNCILAEGKTWCNSLDRGALIQWSAKSRITQESFIENLKTQYLEESMILTRMESEFKMLENPDPSRNYFEITRSEDYVENTHFRNTVDNYWRTFFTVECLRKEVNALSRILHGKGIHVEGDSIIVGNSPDEVKSYENVQDMGGEVSEELSMKRFPYDSKIQDHGELGEFLGRPVMIFFSGSGGWNASRFHNITLNPWNAYLSSPTVRAKLRNYAFLRATICLRVAFTGTPFHQGKVMLVPVPMPSDNLNYEAWSTIDLTDTALTHYLSTFPMKKVLSVHDNKPVEIKVPYFGYLPIGKLYNESNSTLTAASAYDDFSKLLDFVMVNLNSLDVVSPTAGPVTVSVYAWLEDVELGTSTGTRIDIAVESDERKIGPIEKVTTKMAHSLYALQDIPYLGRYALAGASLSSSLSEISSVLGYSYPTKENDPTYVKPYTLQNGAHTIGAATGKKITLDPRQEVTVDSSFCNVEEDEMNISYICKIPSFILEIEWDTGATPMTPIYEIPVTPAHPAHQFTSATTRYTQPSNTSFCSGPFSYWTGDMEYTLQFVKTKFHRGKIAIVWEPNAWQSALSSGSQYLNWQNTMIVDLQETEVVNYKVHWKRSSDWLPLSDLADWGEPEYCNGKIKIFPITSLTSPDLTVPVYINVWTHSRNMRFNMLNDTQTMKTNRISVESYEYLVGDPPQEFDLNEKTNDGQNASVLYFGEEPISFRGLIKKFDHYDDLAPVNSANTSQSWLMPITPIPNSRNLLNYLRYAYVGRRGGYRYRFIAIGGATSPGPCNVFLSSPSTLYADTIVNSAIGYVYTSLNLNVRFTSDLENSFEVEIPYYNPNLMVPNYNEASVVRSWIPLYLRTFRVNVFKTTALGGVPYQVDIAAADDFSYVRYIGPPGLQETI
jgi:hypothetical protein